MWGAPLPSHFEVIDTELAGAMWYLKSVVDRVEREEGEGATAGCRVLLIMDCKPAMELMEQAWRKGRMEGVAGMERAGVLEAICRYRRRLELVTCMYCPAHRESGTECVCGRGSKGVSEQRKRRGGAGAAEGGIHLQKRGQGGDV